MPRVQWYWDSKRTGERIQLTNLPAGIETPKGAAGHGAPPLEVSYESIPGIAGQTITQIKHGTNEVRLPIFVQGQDWNDLENRLRGLIKQFDGLDGLGTLGCVNTNGRVSELSCIVTEGLRMDQAELLGNSACKFELTFQAPYPYWRGETVTQSFTGGVGKPWFPMLPVRLGESTLLGMTTVTTDSDVDAYPVWTIVGPGQNPKLTNVTTGEVFAMSYTLADGQRIVIDTNEGVKSVRDGTTGARLLYAATDRSLWPLQAGTNQINIELQNATAASYVTLSYRDNRLSP